MIFINEKLKVNLRFIGRYPQTIKYAIMMSENIADYKFHHLYQFACFISDLNLLGFTLSNEVKPYYRIITISIDPPKIDSAIKNILESSSVTIVLLAENPTYLYQKLEVSLNYFDHVIHSYDTDEINRCSSFRHKTDTSFLYKYIPEVNSENSLRLKSFKASVFCSNIKKSKPSLYGFRRHLINSASILYGNSFLFCGRDWQEGLTIKNSIKHISKVFTKLPTINLSQYYGAPIDKSLLLTCKTTFAIENYVNLEGYTTEKALEPLIYSCIPLYVGPKENNWLSNYFEVHQPDSLALFSKVNHYSEFSLSETQHLAANIRKEINSHLSSGKILTSFKTCFDLLCELVFCS